MIAELPALAELERMKAEWLVQGVTLAEDLMTVVRELGAETVEFTRTLTRFNEGNVHALYYDRTGSYLPAEKKYSRSTCVAVWVGDDQVCSLTTTNDPYHAGQAREFNIFIPGKWVDTLLAHLPDARRRVANREQQEQTEKARKLAARLLIGKTV